MVVKSEVAKDLEEAKLKITKLESILEKERSTVKSLKDEIGNHRDKALNLKREKKELTAKLDEKENKLILLQKNHARLCEKSVKNDNLLTEQTKVLNTKISEFENVQKKKLEVDQLLKKSLEELETVNKQKASDNDKKANPQFTCSICEDQFKHRIDLSQHLRINHCKDQVSQTEVPKVITSDYFCFYCDEEINTIEKLQEHQVECPEIGIYIEQNVDPPLPTTLPWTRPPPSFAFPGFSLPGFPFQGFPIPMDSPCYTCSEVLETKTKLREHYDLKHSEIILYWCDVCLTNFGSDRGLKSHLRNAHKIFE